MVASENLSVTVSDDHPPVVVVAGQIDSYTSSMLEQALESIAATESVGVDLTDVTFLDSSALRVIVRDHKRHVAAEATLTIIRPSEPVRRLLDITGLTSLLTIQP